MDKIHLEMIGGGFGAFIGDTHRKAARICNAFTLVGGSFSADFEKSNEICRKCFAFK